MSEHLDRLREIVAGLPSASPTMEPYLKKVHERAYEVTDEDVEALRAAGVSEDEIFEQTVGAAIVEGLRRHDAAARVLG